mmetsp:Transcript_27757/g.50146  ORF Transcript_27757/g.50146 Transcript_27757/m.50146 type:complete len:225 (+) Transcript_27757:263-937(+)
MPSSLHASSYTAGFGFFSETMSPAKMEILSAKSGRYCFTTAVTEASLLVEQTASFQPAASAAVSSSLMPSRRESSPEFTISVKSSVFSLWSSTMSGCSGLGGSSSVQASAFMSVKYRVMRSLPPPVVSSSPYSSTSHSMSKPFSLKALLKATRWPSRSVSTKVPSQSSKSAPSMASFPKASATNQSSYFSGPENFLWTVPFRITRPYLIRRSCSMRGHTPNSGM